VSDLRGRRAAGFALAAVLALVSLVACSADGATAPIEQSADSTAATSAQTAVAPTEPTVDPATVESVVVRATDCNVDPRFGRDLDGIRFMLTGFGPLGIDAPHEALDGSFTCFAEPVGTLGIGAALFGDPAQAVEMVEWLRGGDICRPVAAVGPWMLFSGRPLDGPLDSPLLEEAVTELGGKMTATCR
jgi:hypothetical protein